MGRIVLSAAIMTHPARLRQAEDLCEKHPELSATVVADPEPGAVRSALRCAREAWRAVPPEATHHLVLQDDAELCDGFLDAVLDAVAMRPDDALALFTEWGSRTAHLSRIAAIRGAGWAEAVDEYVPSLALILPAEAARRFAGFEYQSTADDVAMRAFLDEVGIAAYVRVPNLVEHRAMPSVAGNDEMGERRSVCYFPHATEVSSIAVDGLPVVPHFSWWEGRSVCRVRSDTSWRKIPTRDFLADRGVDVDGFLASGVHADSGISEILFSGLRLTAFTIGMIAEPRDASAIHGRIADRALATLPSGGLRRFVPRSALVNVSVRLKPMIVSAVRSGAALGSVVWWIQ
jgi:hypothetical protein